MSVTSNHCKRNQDSTSVPVSNNNDEDGVVVALAINGGMLNSDIDFLRTDEQSDK